MKAPARWFNQPEPALAQYSDPLFLLGKLPLVFLSSTQHETNVASFNSTRIALMIVFLDPGFLTWTAKKDKWRLFSYIINPWYSPIRPQRLCSFSCLRVLLPSSLNLASHAKSLPRIQHQARKQFLSTRPKGENILSSSRRDSHTTLCATFWGRILAKIRCQNIIFDGHCWLASQYGYRRW